MARTMPECPQLCSPGSPRRSGGRAEQRHPTGETSSRDSRGNSAPSRRRLPTPERCVSTVGRSSPAQCAGTSRQRPELPRADPVQLRPRFLPASGGGRQVLQAMSPPDAHRQPREPIAGLERFERWGGRVWVSGISVRSRRAQRRSQDRPCLETGRRRRAVPRRISGARAGGLDLLERLPSVRPLDFVARELGLANAQVDEGDGW